MTSHIGTNTPKCVPSRWRLNRDQEATMTVLAALVMKAPPPLKLNPFFRYPDDMLRESWRELCGIFPDLQDKFRGTGYLQVWACLVIEMGHTPSTAGTLRKKFRKNSGTTPEALSELFLEFPSRVRLGSPKPYNSRHLKAPEHFQNSLPPSTAGDASFSEVVPERASQSWSWNSQQYWGHF